MKTNICLTISALAIAWAGCSNPADGVAAAKVTESTNSTASAESTSTPTADARRFVFNGETSKIEFIGSKVTGSHDGGFKAFDGEVLVAEDGKLADSGTKVVIDTTSLWSDNDRLTGHLKNPDFFDVEKYPAATFVTTDLSEGTTNVTVTGDLTLHGITRQISFPAQIEVKDDAVKLQAKFSINRFHFDMKYPGKADDLIREEVVLKLDINAKPAPATQAASL